MDDLSVDLLSAVVNLLISAHQIPNSMSITHSPGVMVSY